MTHDQSDIPVPGPSDDIPEHLLRPHLRRILPQPVSQGEKKGVALQDPLGLAPRTMVVAPAVMKALPHLNGEWTLKQIADHGGADESQVLQLVRSLDEVGLLWGPTCSVLEQQRRDAIHADGVLPLRQGGMIGDDDDAVRILLQGWMDETEDPDIEFPVRGLIAPRLDHHVMWPVYAAVYHAARTAGADRILLLGNNHYGIGDGVVLTRVGVQSPLGRLEADTDMVDALIDQLGDRSIVDELDHLADHGIEMQAPWITAALGDIPVVGALLPDPLQPPIDDDETARITPSRFMTVARDVLDAAPGRTLVIATGDLSHVGPRFGEPRPVDEDRQIDVERHDREFMSTLMTGDLEAIDDAVKWHRNPTRWSCLGAARAMIGIVQPGEMELIDYRQQLTDDQGSAMITAAGIAAGGA